MATKKAVKLAKRTYTKRAPAVPAADAATVRAQADLTRAIASAMSRPAGRVVVGIRNICGSTVGIAAWGTEPEISLNPYDPADPNSVAMISLARWQVLRRGRLYDIAAIERFDEILDAADERAPEDKPNELAPNHAKNRISDPVWFIEQQSDAEMRSAIFAMTSENSVQRVMAACDAKFQQLYDEAVAAGERRAVDAAKANRPVCYQQAEQYAERRLGEIRPHMEEVLQAARSPS